MARLAFTADLHLGVRAAGDEATRRLAAWLRADPPDLLVLAGDLGTEDHFEECLALFADLPCPKALVPGNHDLWVTPDDPRGDSLLLYEHVLPEIARRREFYYLDHGPLFLPEVGLSVVGTVNWYDYSWSLDKLRAALPEWEFHLANKLFTRGRHNDGNFIRWELNDVTFTRRVVARFRDQLLQEIAAGRLVIAVTHHPCLYGLNYPKREPPTVDGLLWEAFSGNRELEDLLLEHQERIPFAICGHTHYARETAAGSIRGYNIGGDYDFKRLLTIDWPSGTVTGEEFV